MPRAELTITVPEDVWIGDVSRSFPDATFRVLTAFADEDAGVALVEVTAADARDVVAALVAREAVTDVDPLHRGDDEVLVRIETAEPLLLFPLRESGVPLSFPFALTDGEAAWELTAPDDRFAALGERLEAFGIEFDVDAIRQGVEFDRLLTTRQRELLTAAVEAGYYDTPRECSLTELAASLEMAKSTVSETLHRAEERVIKEFVADDDRPATAAEGPI